MESTKGEESGEMYSPDEQGEYAPEASAACFSVQGLMDTLTTIETEVTEVQLPSMEFAMQLKVMMADHPGCPNPPHSHGMLGWSCMCLRVTPCLGTLIMCTWMVLEQPTCSSLTSRANMA